MEKLGEVLDEAVGYMQSGLLKSEAQVKMAVIVPVLQALGWDATNPKEFLPEYPVDSGWVDYALIVHKMPLVFIEAKKLGYLSENYGIAKAEEQLFSYAVNKGIPLLVLTDGNIWDFYLSMAAGVPGDRRFCRIELDHAGELSGPEGLFRTFLIKDRVASGQAKLDAEELHQDNKLRKQAREALPDAWQRLLASPDDLLVNLLTEEVNSLSGIMPHNEDVRHFLRRFSSAPGAPKKVLSLAPKSQTKKPTPKNTQPKSPPSAGKTKIIGYRLGGREVSANSGAATLVAVLNALQKRDSGFLQRLYNDPYNRTKTKTARVSQRREELYSKEFQESKNFDQKNMCKELDDGWWVGTNLSANRIRRNIKWACDIAGVGFGTELTLIEK